MQKNILAFTLHFATINTAVSVFCIVIVPLFTLHFATINTFILLKAIDFPKNLHYTLLLLIHRQT